MSSLVKHQPELFEILKFENEMFEFALSLKILKVPLRLDSAVVQALGIGLLTYES